MGPWEMNNYVNLILCIQFIFIGHLLTFMWEKKPQSTNVDMAYYNSHYVHVEFFSSIKPGFGGGEGGGGLPTHFDINRLRDDVCG